MKQKVFTYILFFVLIGFSSFGQTPTDSEVPRQKKPNPYKPLRSEPYQFFKFTKFERHFDLKAIDRSLDSLDKKEASQWHLYDSVILFSNLAKIKNYDDAYRIANLIQIERFPIHNYEIAKDLIYTYKHKLRPDLSLKVIDTVFELQYIDTLTHHWLRNIHEARQNEAVDWRFLLDNHILDFPVDTVLPFRKKNDQFYKDSIVVPLKKLEAILKDEVLYTPKDDEIIAEIFYEIGFYLESVGTSTQSYIAYSMGKFYNPGDIKIPKRVRVVKDRLIRKKYRIPGVRKLFPKYKKGRFNYEILKQKIIKEQLDTIPKVKLPTMKPVEKRDLVPRFSNQLLILAGFILLLLFVLIFVRTKKRK